MMDVKLISNRCGDWAGLYIDGKLAYEGHEVTLRDLFDSVGERLPVTFKQRETSTAEEALLWSAGRFPKTLEE